MSFEKILEDIEQQLSREEVALAELESTAAGMRDRVNRLRKAHRDLSGQTKPRKRKPSSGQKTPSADGIQAILAVLQESPVSMSIKDIEKQTGRSHSHVDGAVRYLRANELIRLAGKRGTAYVYAPMRLSEVEVEAA